MKKKPSNTTQRVALVTGAAKGLGAATAKQLAKDGYMVVVHYFHSEKEATALVRGLRRSNQDSSMLRADLRDAEEAHAMIDLIIQRYGRLDVVVNNVGGFIFKPLAQTSTTDWQEVMNTNLNATFYICNAVIPHMRKNRGGRIINLGAVDAARMIVRPRTTPYYIAKTGIIMLTKQLAADNARFGITVNTISPGILESSVVKIPTPTGKYVAFADITRVISFLVMAENHSVNGANIEIADGFSFGQ
ncbi:MAG: SDR family NAD(P)-dependent oxidoreductase [Candidatus Kerfeldbacteria bacterium]|nr:SDR family NAD(P)-dependent oxidoreductase [Candidatus Kerfeldbacteria bacterium]